MESGEGWGKVGDGLVGRTLRTHRLVVVVVESREDVSLFVVPRRVVVVQRS